MEIEKEVWEKIIKLSEQGYPFEVCGILVGKIEKDKKRITMVYPTENINRERARDRYEIDPREILRTEEKIRACGKEIIGFFHSHPDNPPIPSIFDRKRAWPLYSYIIVSIDEGRFKTARSWVLNDEDGEFEEEEMEIV